MVQCRAARHVTNRYWYTSSVTSMLEHLEWERLESCRTKVQLTMLFKIINGLVDPASQYLVVASTLSHAHHTMKLTQIPSSSDYNKFSFFPRTVRQWNSLPASVAEASSLVSFKRELFAMPF